MRHGIITTRQRYLKYLLIYLDWMLTGADGRSRVLELDELSWVPTKDTHSYLKKLNRESPR
jgi:hypothetical protein